VAGLGGTEQDVTSFIYGGRQPEGLRAPITSSCGEPNNASYRACNHDQPTRQWFALAWLPFLSDSSTLNRIPSVFYLIHGMSVAEYHISRNNSRKGCVKIEPSPIVKFRNRHGDTYGYQKWLAYCDSLSETALAKASGSVNVGWMLTLHAHISIFHCCEVFPFLLACPS
jgi:hypothetical protein